MRIKKIDIVNFGKFSNYNMDLEDNMQVLYGSNEDGKTTLMTFISMMFYSSQSQARSIDQNPRRKYTPWNGSAMEGAITFTWADKTYHLSKLFGNTPSQDKTTLMNIETGEDIPLERGQEVGEYFFGLDLSGFERSSFIGQVGSIDSGATNKTDDIADKLLVNLVSTGDEDVSSQEVLLRLNNAKKGLANARKTSGTLVLAQNNLDDLHEEKQDILYKLDQQKDKQEQYSLLESQLNELNNLKQVLEGFEAHKELNQLSQILSQQKDLKGLSNNIFNENVPLSNMDKFISDLREISLEHESVFQSLQPLRNSLKENDNTPITLEENEIAIKLDSQIKQLDKLESTWNEQISPKLLNQIDDSEEISVLSEKLEKLENDKNKLKDSFETWQNSLIEKEQIEKDISQLEEKLSQTQKLYSEQKVFKIERIENQQQMLDIQKSTQKKSVNTPVLAVGIVLFFAFAVLAITVSPYIWAGEVIALALIGFAFIKGNNGTSPQLQESSEKMSELKLELEKWEKEQSTYIQEIKNTADLKKSKLREIDISLNTHKNTSESYTNITSEYDLLNKLLAEKRLRYDANSSSNIPRLKDFLEDAASLDVLHSDIDYDSKAGINSFTSKINQVNADKKALLEKLLEEKKATNIADYNNKYLNYQSQQNNRNLLKEYEGKIQELEKQFVSTFSRYKSVNNPKEANVQHLELLKNYKQYENLKNQIAIKADTLSLEKYETHDLESRIAEKQNLAEKYKGENLDKTKMRVELLQSRDILSEMQQLQKDIQLPERSLEEVEHEIRELSEQVESMEHYYNSLEIAIDQMEKADEEMRQSFGPKLNQLTGEIFSKLTSDKYGTLTVDKAYDISVKEGAHYRDWRYLSSGTIDQAYLALRLAVSHLISPAEGTLPILLDDVLIQYDDTRALDALSFLKTYAKDTNTQIILLSCHSRMTSMANQLDISNKPLI